jgi:hypothetical protein
MQFIFPVECVQAGVDSIPFVYTKKRHQADSSSRVNQMKKYVLIEKGS